LKYGAVDMLDSRQTASRLLPVQLSHLEHEACLVFVL
jgi:hypothetical protein